MASQLRARARGFDPQAGYYPNVVAVCSFWTCSKWKRFVMSMLFDAFRIRAFWGQGSSIAERVEMQRLIDAETSSDDDDERMGVCDLVG